MADTAVGTAAGSGYAYNLEEAYVDDDGDDFEYAPVDVEDVDSDYGDDREDLRTAMRGLSRERTSGGRGRSDGAGASPTSAAMNPGDAGRGGSPDHYNDNVGGGRAAGGTAVAPGRGGSGSAGEAGGRPRLERRPEVIDDFIRNFLGKMGMNKTLNAFQTEWYELQHAGRVDGIDAVPDVYQHNQDLEDQVLRLRREVQKYKGVASKSRSTWDKLRKERDHHRMHHSRILEEKKRLMGDLKRLKEHYEHYEPALEQLKKKYDAAIRQKSLAVLEVDKLRAQVAALRASVEQLQRGRDGRTGGEAAAPAVEAVGAADAGRDRGAPRAKGTPGGSGSGGRSRRAGGSGNGGSGRRRGARGKASDGGGSSTPNTSRDTGDGDEGGSGSRKGKRRRRRPAVLPEDPVENPHAAVEIPAVHASAFALAHSWEAHEAAVSCVGVHPEKPVIATGSDDGTWRMFSIPDGGLVMSGEGHRDWVSSLSFHPKGGYLATGSADSTVRLWSFAKSACVATLKDHTQGVWDVDFHHTGAFLVSGSMDQSIRVWDVGMGTTTEVLRGHVGSVNSVAWQPYTNVVGSSAADKTVSLWDARSGLCVQTFYGHTNSVSNIAFNRQGSVVASSDADGVVKLWDVRACQELGSVANTAAEPVASNGLAFDRSGVVLAITADDATCKLFDLSQADVVAELPHDDAVQDAVFDSDGNYLVTVADDCMVRLWS